MRALLANIVRWSLRDGGKVIIDDAHQGLVAFYDPEAFFGDSRLHATLWWLLGLWLLFVLASQRLRPSQSSWNPVDITGFVRATGGFMARVMRPATVGQQMIANFFNDARKRLRPARGRITDVGLVERADGRVGAGCRAPASACTPRYNESASICLSFTTC